MAEIIQNHDDRSRVIKPEFGRVGVENFRLPPLVERPPQEEILEGEVEEGIERASPEPNEHSDVYDADIFPDEPLVALEPPRELSATPPPVHNVAPDRVSQAYGDRADPRGQHIDTSV